MRRRALTRPALALALGAVLALAACDSGQELLRPEEVVRAWSAALDAGDNEAAGDLFAPNATVVQGDFVAILATHADAVAFNASLPCSGQIVELIVERDQVTATFLLGDRAATACDAPGRQATAIFVVEDGKIVVWQQVLPAGTQAGGGTEV